MIFPIGDDQVKRGHFPIFSYSLIAVNVFVFVYVMTLGKAESNAFYFAFGAVPAEVSNFGGFSSLLTSMFLHAGIMHILGNMLFLWVFADNIEATVGSFKFILFYLIGGLIAAYAHVLSDPSSQIPMVGASGAISAVMGAYLVMFPGSRIRVLIIVFTVRVSAIIFLLFWIFQQFQSGLSSINDAVSGGVAWWAHIGGFVFGVIAGGFFRFVSPRIKHDDQYTVLKD